MIIACPACTTRYVVPDSAIGVEGRTVRCAKCRHSWFQDGPAAADPLPQPPVPAPPPPPPEEAPEPVTPAAEPATEKAAFDPPPREPETTAAAWDDLAEPASDPAARKTVFDPRPRQAEATEPAMDEPVGEPTPPPVFAAPAPAEPDPPIYSAPSQNTVDVVFEQSVSSFEYEPPFRPRRNPAKLWTAAAIAFALLVAGVIGAVGYWGLPSWVPVAGPTFGPAQPDLKLDFPPERQDRRTLPNGTEFFGASGTVTNIGQEPRRVPPILIVLRDGRERIVYTWEVRPAKSELVPGESVTINEAVTDVPRSAKIAEIGWKR